MAFWTLGFLPDSSMYIYQCPVLALQFDNPGLEFRCSSGQSKCCGRVGEELDLTGLSFLDLQVDFVRIGLLMFSGA